MANGLITKQTDLKSLKYSSMPLGSQSPYVTKNIGQAPGTQIGLETQSRIDDTSRIAQMLIDKPGIKYLLNEALLNQASNDRSIAKARKDGKSIAGAVLKQVKYTAQLLGSTLAQVPVNGTGTHFVKGFRTDTYLQDATTRGFAQFFGAGGVEGAQYALQGKPVPASTLIDGTKIIQTTAAENSIGISNQNIQGDITPLEQPIIKPFKEEDQKRKAKNSTKNNITNALTGSAIALSGSQPETTATPGIKTQQNLITGSISNKDVKYDLDDNGVNLGKQYTAANTYTGTDTKTNIATVLSAKGAAATVGIGRPNRIYTPGPDVGGESPNATLREDSFDVAQEYYLEQRGVRDITALNLQAPRISDLYKSGSQDPYLAIQSSSNGVITDFRNKYADTYSFNYNNAKIKRETRVNLGDQGKKKSSTFYTKYTEKDKDAIDQLNALDIQYDGRAAGTQDGRDLAKLYFEIITPDNTNGVGTFLHFRAFIDNIDDSYNADWQGFNYVGRGEKFYTYGGFERDITVGFKIAAATRSELKPLYKKMVYLASATAPTYGGQGFMRGTLARITIGSYFSQIPGVITSVKYNLIDDMPWEIAMQNPEAGTDDDVQELPMGLQCSVSFKAIHDFTPVTGLKYYMTNPNPQGGSKPFF